MIKGGGGAHVREKILAAASQEMVVIVDQTKVVPSVGVHKLPVEVLQFGAPSTRKKLEDAQYRGAWRMKDADSLYVTENGNFLFDIEFDSPPLSPEKENERIQQIPGVIDTGFFFGIAGRVIIGYLDGSIKVLE